MPDPMTGYYEGLPRAERVEVITSVQQQHRWSTEEKLRIIEETYLPGNSILQMSQSTFGHFSIDNVATGQEGQCAKTSRTPQETTPTGVRHQLRRVFDQEFRIDTGMILRWRICFLLPARDHRAQALRHDQRQRHVHNEETYDRRHRQEMHVSGGVIATKKRRQFLELNRLPDRQT